MKISSLLILFFLIASSALNAQSFRVKVVGVSDGDTFTAINNDNLQLRIRVYGIDTPEKNQDFRGRSRQTLASYIFGKNITINVQSQDAWGRYIAYVYTPDGSDVSLMMLQNGMAWHFKKYDSTEKYSKAELNAKNQRLGLWSRPNPIAPWEFRKK